MEKMLKNEMDYSLVLQILKQLLEKQLLTKDEFIAIRQEYIDKYNPYIGKLSFELER